MSELLNEFLQRANQVLQQVEPLLPKPQSRLIGTACQPPVGSAAAIAVFFARFRLVRIFV